jgi:hypothetical protein
MAARPEGVGHRTRGGQAPLGLPWRVAPLPTLLSGTGGRMGVRGAGGPLWMLAVCDPGPGPPLGSGTPESGPGAVDRQTPFGPVPLVARPRATAPKGLGIRRPALAAPRRCGSPVTGMPQTHSRSSTAQECRQPRAYRQSPGLMIAAGTRLVVSRSVGAGGFMRRVCHTIGGPTS